MDVKYWHQRAVATKSAAHKILSAHELSPSRIIHLEGLLKRLSGTPVDVQDYFHEAITCLEQELYRASIVMSWAGHFNVFTESLVQKYEADIRSKRPKWKFRDAAELKESISEFQIIEIGKVVNFINRAQYRIFDGQLSLRNQCAHPTMFKPSMNSAIGYVDDMISQTLIYIKS